MNKPPWASLRGERREKEGVQIREVEKASGVLTEKKKREMRRERGVEEGGGKQRLPRNNTG